MANSAALAKRPAAAIVAQAILNLVQAQPSHEACVCHVTDFLGLGQPTVSHHLACME